jgi:hypothetical protein
MKDEKKEPLAHDDGSSSVTVNLQENTIEQQVS